MNRCSWPGTSSKEEKPWGHEISWTGLFHGKEIFIKSGFRTSLKFNVQKNELLYVQSGRVIAEYADEGHFKDSNKCPASARELLPGDILNVQAGCPYRLSALDNSIVFEISDRGAFRRVIIEDDYGRESKDSSQEKLIFKPLIGQ